MIEYLTAPRDSLYSIAGEHISGTSYTDIGVYAQAIIAATMQAPSFAGQPAFTDWTAFAPGTRLVLPQ